MFGYIENWQSTRGKVEKKERIDRKINKGKKGKDRESESHLCTDTGERETHIITQTGNS